MSVVLGVDIVKGSPHGKIKPKYAIVIIESGNGNLDDFKETEKVVSRAKLFRIARDIKPDIMAVDNIYEVFKSKEELISFLKEVPPKTRLIQVSGKNGSLPSLCKRYGIRINIRDPMDEARACAYLASYGVGYEVSVFLDKTRITVSRGRSLGKGGWRQKKYSRKVHDAVRRVYREIKSKLDEMNVEYVEEMRKGFGGISKGILIVNLPKRDVPVNSFRTKDVQVRVEAVEKEKIEFIPLSPTKLYTIVGIDPGTTTAVAVVDLNGNLIEVKSKKGWRSGEVIEFISSIGKPVVIATDKSVAPDYVQKIKAAFNAVLYTPKDDISVDKKRELAARYKPMNDHERDAVAAAIDAFNSYKNKLRNIEKRVPRGVDSDRIKAEMIRGRQVRFREGRETEEDEKEKRVSKTKMDEAAREEIRRRERTIKELREENRILRERIEEMKREIDRLRSKLVALSKEEHERIRRDNVVKTLQNEIKNLRIEIKEKDEVIERLKERVEVLKRIKVLAFQGWKEVKVLRKFTKDEIERVERDVGIAEGDVIYIVDSSGGGKSLAEGLCEKGIKAVIYENEMSHLAVEVFDRNNVARIHVSEVEILASDDVAIVNAEKFEEVYRKKMEEMREKKIDLIEKLVEEYKSRWC